MDTDNSGADEVPDATERGPGKWASRIRKSFQIPHQTSKEGPAYRVPDAAEPSLEVTRHETRGRFSAVSIIPQKIRNLGAKPRYHFVIMNQSLEDYPNISAIKLQLELEKRGHTVETVHWESGNPHVVTGEDGVDRLVADKCELNITDLREREGFENYGDLVAMLGEHTMRQADRRREGLPISNLEVQFRRDGLYLVYNEVNRDLREINGVNLMVDRADDQDKLEQEVILQKKLEDAGAVPLTSTDAIKISKDKVLSAQRLRERGVPMPEGFEITGDAPFDEADIRERFGRLKFPVMVKDALGSGATGVTACNTIDMAVEVARRIYELRDLHGVHHSVDIQELIPPLKSDEVKNEQGEGTGEFKPHLLRIMVLNGKVLGAIKWIADPGITELPMKDGVFRPGVRAEIYELSKAQKAIAEKAAKACGQGLAGLDAMMRDDSKGNVDPKCLCIIETNSAPGFASFEKYFGDVVPKIVDAFISMVQKPELILAR